MKGNQTWNIMGNEPAVLCSIALIEAMFILKNIHWVGPFTASVFGQHPSNFLVVDILVIARTLHKKVIIALLVQNLCDLGHGKILVSIFKCLCSSILVKPIFDRMQRMRNISH